MTHIMVDLETLSTEPNAHIVSIGAVKFDRERGVYDKYYQPVVTPEISLYTQSYISVEGFHISNDTVQWWYKQSDRARAVLTDPNAAGMSIALKYFAQWALLDTLVEDVKLWGNGASFDNVILSSAYRICNRDRPWKFWNDRCYRTIRGQYPEVKFYNHGIAHHALDDAEAQAEHLLKTPARLD